MNVYTSDKVRNIVLMGHGGVGKTTIAEAMLFASGAISRQGKVADGKTVSDFDPEEIKRKFSVNTSLIPIEWKDCKINVLDTPGYFDFVGEVQQALSVADAASEAFCREAAESAIVGRFAKPLKLHEL